MDIAELRHTFATRIRKLREGTLNQGEFADTVGISRGAMSYYEQEQRTPDIGVLRAICTKYSVSADYLLGIIPDMNHAVSDVCLETSLSPASVKTLSLITRLINSGEIRSHEHMMDIFDQDFLEVMKLTAFSSLPEVLNILLENDEGKSLLILLGAIILGAEVDSGGENIVIKIKSAAKNFEVAVPLDNITASLWVNIQSHADELKKKMQTESAESEPTQPN